jgi:hypothetical protein
MVTNEEECYIWIDPLQDEAEAIFMAEPILPIILKSVPHGNAW